jgi:hypothetical protein
VSRPGSGTMLSRFPLYPKLKLPGLNLPTAEAGGFCRWSRRWRPQRPRHGPHRPGLGLLALPPGCEPRSCAPTTKASLPPATSWRLTADVPGWDERRCARSPSRTRSAFIPLDSSRGMKAENEANAPGPPAGDPLPPLAGRGLPRILVDAPERPGICSLIPKVPHSDTFGPGEQNRSPE